MEFGFLLKKIITIALMPLSLGMFIFGLGLWLLKKNKKRESKIFLSLGFVWITFVSYEPIASSLLYRLEMLYPTLQVAPKDIKYIYVLGNANHTNSMHPVTSQSHPVSTVRLNEAIRLYHQLQQKPTIIVSGYSGIFDPTPGAIIQKKLAIALGIKEKNLHIEPTPKDTQEEAEAAKKYIGKEPFILVTSASHMHRALKLFKHEGLLPIPAPTNHLANIKYHNYLGFFSPCALHKTTIFWHEILGLIWQKLKSII